MPETIRLLTPADAPAYKPLRDAMLALHPSAFTSDAETERGREPSSYAARLGGGPLGFTLGAWRDAELVGAISCEREPRPKAAHIAHVVGMMVHPAAEGHGLGRALLAACLGRLRATTDLRLVTLSVTADNPRAVALYAAAGFTRYGTLPDALRVGDRFFDKDLMVLDLHRSASPLP